MEVSELPLISIIIPTYNRADLLLETLESVLEQTYQNWECIVVDDGSEENTELAMKEWVQKDDRFQFFKRPNNRPKGANSCRNYGFELSKGDFIQWFDDDDIMLPNYLQDRIKLFEPNTQIVIGSGLYVDKNLTNEEPILIAIRDTLYKDYFLWKSHILTPSVLFRKSFLVSKELFSPLISTGQETELFSRLFFGLNEDSYKIIEKPYFLYRFHSASKTGQKKIYKTKTTYSKLYISIQNFSRGLLCSDRDIVQTAFTTAIYFFKLACANKDTKNISFAIDYLPKAIGKINKNKERKLRFWMRLYRIPFFQRQSINRRMANCIDDLF
jgi:glycosyltransferase involved in cell wall biosynthesis